MKHKSIKLTLIRLLCLVGTLTVCAFLVGGCGSHTETIETPIRVNPYAPYPPESYGEVVPTAQSNLYFAKIRNGDNGYFGLPGFPIGVFDDTWLGKEPDWEYADGHGGGAGNTLQIISHKHGIEMLWAYNNLYLIILTEGWQGQIQTGLTELTGIRLGSKGSDFLDKFPDAKIESKPFIYDGNSYTTYLVAPKDPIYHMKNADRKLEAYCNKDDVIVSIWLSDFSPD